MSLHDELACLAADSGRGSGGSLAAHPLNDSSDRSSVDGESEEVNGGGSSSRPTRKKKQHSVASSSSGVGGGSGRFSSSLLIYHPNSSSGGGGGNPSGHSNRHGGGEFVYTTDSDALAQLETATSCTGPMSYGESDLTSFASEMPPLNQHYVPPLSQIGRGMSQVNKNRLNCHVKQVL